MKNEIKKCPKCKKKYNQHSALSRVDNKTEICPICGQTESIVQFKSYSTRLRVDSLTPIEKEIRKQVVQMNIMISKSIKRYQKELGDRRSRIGQEFKKRYSEI